MTREQLITKWTDELKSFIPGKDNADYTYEKIVTRIAVLPIIRDFLKDLREIDNE